MLKKLFKLFTSSKPIDSKKNRIPNNLTPTQTLYQNSVKKVEQNYAKPFNKELAEQINLSPSEQQRILTFGIRLSLNSSKYINFDSRWYRLTPKGTISLIPLSKKQSYILRQKLNTSKQTVYYLNNSFSKVDGIWYPMKKDGDFSKKKVNLNIVHQLEAKLLNGKIYKNAIESKKDQEEISIKNSKENELIEINIMDQEFELLVDEIKSKGFNKSAEVSNYIIRQKLGNKYQNISGVLVMSNSKDTWKFNGGFPVEIYAKLCKRLNLSNNGSDSKVVEFTSFKDLNRKKY
ncbi:MAG: hypothetical protein ACOYK5_02315 [Bacteroidia bacterium]